MPEGFCKPDEGRLGETDGFLKDEQREVVTAWWLAVAQKANTPNRVSAKMRDKKKRHSSAQKSLDTFSRKRGRGRPGVRAEEILGRAENYRLIFNQVVPNLDSPLLMAKSEEEVVEAFACWPGYKNQFAPLAKLIVKVMKDPKFPKTPDARANFLADSLAARGEITARSSRDLCERQRAKGKAASYIVRCEFYIECSCGFKGVSHDNSCRQCGAGIPLGLNPLLKSII